MFNNYQQVLDDNGQLSSKIIIGLPDYTAIPNDPMNSDWKEYQVWLAEGNTPLPPEE